MSQQAVEGTLGRLITDSEFRRGFYADPAATCRREALDLTTREIEALMGLDQLRLQTFAKGIDARIVRAALGGVHYWSSWASASRERGKVGPSTNRPKLARGEK
ncbi:MAG: Franean1_4349 family RiPP [Gaiellaceae bacterium]